MEASKRFMTDATSRYRQVSVETADQASLIIMLFDGLQRFASAAIVKMRAGEYAHEECFKARDIALHLHRSLRPDGSDLAKNLNSLYFYVYKQLVLAHMERNANRIEELLPVVQELRAGWEGLRTREKTAAAAR